MEAPRNHRRTTQLNHFHQAGIHHRALTTRHNDSGSQRQTQP